MSNNRGHVDSGQDPDSLLFVSLLILGLDPVALEHKLKIPVNEKCFTRINRRLGDNLLHFLFVCLDREKAAKVFRECWPILDKKHEAHFYKATFEWYKTLQQSYKQPVPTVMAKTFMTPGGPKFTSTLMTLARIALHNLATKRGPTHTILNAPVHSRNPQQNSQTLQTVEAFKVNHCQKYLVQQKIRQNFLVTLKNKARELSGKYRELCKEGERAMWEFSNALSNNESLPQHQKNMFASASPTTIRKALMNDISRMNETVSQSWNKVDQYQKVEESAWQVLCPLLDGSTSVSHINGSVYLPQVPDVVYKTHTNAINKLNLQGLYHEGKLDLLSLVQFSTLALRSLLDAAHNTYTNDHAESNDQIKVQCGQVTSLAETVNQLSDKISGVQQVFNHSRSSTSLSTTNPLERTGLIMGKPQLCPPAPTYSLLSKPESAMNVSHVPLQLTPDPIRLLSDMKITRSSNTSRPLVGNTSLTLRDDSILCLRKRETDQPSDDYSTYKKQKGVFDKTDSVDALLDSTVKYVTEDLQKDRDYIQHSLQPNCRLSATKLESKVVPPLNPAVKQMFSQPAKQVTEKNAVTLELSNLHELSQKYHPHVMQEKSQESKTKPRFISYTEALKKSNPSLASEKKYLKTEQNSILKTSLITDGLEQTTLSNDKNNGNVCKEYFENFSRMQSLLHIDEIASVDTKHGNDWCVEDDVFASGGDAAHRFDTQKKSPFLPATSVFDTLTDSILCGELDGSLLTDDNVGKQIRRESLSSRRQSLNSARRFSLESSRKPSDIAGLGLEDCSGILDTIDCSLLSTSMEDA